MKSHRFAYWNLEQFDFFSEVPLVVAEAGRSGRTAQQGSARQGRLRYGRKGLGQACLSSETLLAYTEQEEGEGANSPRADDPSRP